MKLGKSDVIVVNSQSEKPEFCSADLKSIKL